LIVFIDSVMNSEGNHGVGSGGGETRLIEPVYVKEEKDSINNDGEAAFNNAARVCSDGGVAGSLAKG